jgi:hypothetical protein
MIGRTLRLRLGNEQMDSWLSLWGCVVGAVMVSAVAVALVSKHAANRLDLFLGTGAALVAGLLLVLLGVLSRQVHRSVSEGKAPWRVRRWELVGHAVGSGVIGLGGWELSASLPGMAGAVTGALLMLSAYAAVLCLGCWSTLTRSLRA